MNRASPYLADTSICSTSSDDFRNMQRITLGYELDAMMLVLVMMQKTLLKARLQNTGCPRRYFHLIVIVWNVHSYLTNPTRTSRTSSDGCPICTFSQTTSYLRHISMTLISVESWKTWLGVAKALIIWRLDNVLFHRYSLLRNRRKGILLLVVVPPAFTCKGGVMERAPHEYATHFESSNRLWIATYIKSMRSAGPGQP